MDQYHWSTDFASYIKLMFFSLIITLLCNYMHLKKTKAPQLDDEGLGFADSPGCDMIECSGELDTQWSDHKINIAL